MDTLKRIVMHGHQQPSTTIIRERSRSANRTISQISRKSDSFISESLPSRISATNSAPRAGDSKDKSERIDDKYAKESSRSPVCEVKQLDDRLSPVFIPLTAEMTGKQLFDEVCHLLGISLECDYFGLRFYKKDHKRWLRMDKSAYKQLKSKSGTSKLLVLFEVKHYPDNPYAVLKEKVSRYFFYLQLRSNFQDGRLRPIEKDKIHWLASLALQEELSSKESNEKISTEEISSYLNALQLFPHQNISDEKEICRLVLLVRDLSVDEAEQEFIRLASQDETYGSDFSSVKDDNNKKLDLSIKQSGIVVFDGNKLIIEFSWTNIIKMNFQGKKFTITVASGQKKQDFHYKFDSKDEAKSFWIFSLDSKCFFTLDPLGPKPPDSIKSKSGLFGRHKFHFSGRSYKEIMCSTPFLNGVGSLNRAASVSPSGKKVNLMDRYATIGGKINIHNEDQPSTSALISNQSVVKSTSLSAVTDEDKSEIESSHTMIVAPDNQNQEPIGNEELSSYPPTPSPTSTMAEQEEDELHVNHTQQHSSEAPIVQEIGNTTTVQSIPSTTRTYNEIITVAEVVEEIIECTERKIIDPKKISEKQEIILSEKMNQSENGQEEISITDVPMDLELTPLNTSTEIIMEDQTTPQQQESTIETTSTTTTNELTVESSLEPIFTGNDFQEKENDEENEEKKEEEEEKEKEGEKMKPMQDEIKQEDSFAFDDQEILPNNAETVVVSSKTELIKKNISVEKPLKTPAPRSNEYRELIISLIVLLFAILLMTAWIFYNNLFSIESLSKLIDENVQKLSSVFNKALQNNQRP